MPVSSALLARLGLAALLTACGQKPDGTPYGVNPRKAAAGHPKPSASRAGRRPEPYANGMPRGAELNAVTNGSSAGQPMSNDQPMSSQ